MTVADRIRKAALGPTPKITRIRSDWIGMRGVWDVGDHRGKFWGAAEFPSANNTERRMFLLFVAEAIEGATS
jgi:hypothetical protein